MDSYIKAILSDKRNPYKLVELCDKSILNNKKELVIKSLHGNYKSEHLFLMLKGLCNNVDLSLIPSLTNLSIMKLISELGTNMDKWKTEKHFVSWLNLSPTIHSSGKSKMRKKIKGFNQVDQIFRMAAIG